MKILVRGSAGHNNGSLSIIKVTVKMLKKQFPETKIELSSTFPEIDSEKCGVPAVRHPVLPLGLFNKVNRIPSLLQCTILAMLCRFFKVDMNWLAETDRFGLLKTLVKTDIIVFCGTDNISDTYGSFFSLIETLYTSLLIAIIMKKPIVVHASQIGPFQSNLTGKICVFLTKLILNKVSLITARDKSSLKKLCEMGVSKPLTKLTADPAFLLEAAHQRRAKQILCSEGIDINVSPLVGINTSAMIYRYLGGSDLETKLRKYVELMADMISYLIEKLYATVVLVPHVFGPRHNDDRVMARKIFSEVKYKRNLKLISREYTPEEVKKIIGQFDLFISTRMHPLIHAISMCTPVIGIDYTFKTRELMKRVGQRQAACHIRNLDFDELVCKIDTVYSARDQIRKSLKAKSKMMEKYALLNFRSIAEFAEKL